MQTQATFYKVFLNSIFFMLLCSISIVNSYGQPLTFVSVATVDTDCGASTGAVTLTPLLSGTYSYLWSNGETTQSITGLAMGDYSCTITHGGTTEIADVSIYRNMELEKLVTGDPTVAIVGNSVTMNPTLPSPPPSNLIADQRTHVYDKTPIDIETQKGSVFAKFASSHPNFPNQTSNPSAAAPPVFYIELIPTSRLAVSLIKPLFCFDANFLILVGGRIPEKIYISKGAQVTGPANYTGHDYTDGAKFEIRFLGHHKVEVYLGTTLIHSATIPQLSSNNEYVVSIGFNDNDHLDRRIAYDLKSSFCTDMPLVKSEMVPNSKYGSVGQVNLSVIEPSHLSNTYTYLWNTGSTQPNLTGLTAGTYTATITSSNGNHRIVESTVYDKLSLEPATTNTILKIVDNSVTVDPALPMQGLVDARTHAYDPKVPIDVVTGGGSVKFSIGAEHPNFSNQHTNTDYYNAIFYIELQAAGTPISPTSIIYDYPFKLLFLYDGKISVLNGYNDNNYNDPTNLIPNFLYHKGGLDIELRFTGNKVVEIYIGGRLMKTETLVEPIDKYYLTVGFHDGSSWQRRIAYDLLTTFKSIVPHYSELKQKLDGGYTQLEDNVLRIKYKQDYAVGGSGETINYKIYKWDRSSHSGSFNASMGINWEEIDLSSFNLNNNEHYTLEFEGNKGEKYVLRFKTKPI